MTQIHVAKYEFISIFYKIILKVILNLSVIIFAMSFSYNKNMVMADL